MSSATEVRGAWRAPVEARLAALSDGFEREEHVVTPLLDRLERGGDVEVSGVGCGWCERRVTNAPRLLGAPFASLAVHVLELAVHVLELVVLILVLIGLVLVGLLVLILLLFGLLLFAVVLGAVSSLRIVAPRLVARLVYGGGQEKLCRCLALEAAVERRERTRGDGGGEPVEARAARHDARRSSSSSRDCARK